MFGRRPRQPPKLPAPGHPAARLHAEPHRLRGGGHSRGERAEAGYPRHGDRGGAALSAALQRAFPAAIIDHAAPNPRRIRGAGRDRPRAPVRGAGSGNPPGPLWRPASGPRGPRWRGSQAPDYLRRDRPLRHRRHFPRDRMPARKAGSQVPRFREAGGHLLRPAREPRGAGGGARERPRAGRELYPEIESAGRSRCCAYRELPDGELFDFAWVRVALDPRDLPGSKAAAHGVRGVRRDGEFRPRSSSATGGRCAAPAPANATTSRSDAALLHHGPAGGGRHGSASRSGDAARSSGASSAFRCARKIFRLASCASWCGASWRCRTLTGRASW